MSNETSKPVITKVTVKDLIEQLQSLPQDAEVILSSDAEGNKYSPLVFPLEVGLYIPESTWAGEIVSEEDYDDDDEPNAVILYPTN